MSREVNPKSQSLNEDLEIKKLGFEKYKLKIQLFKWLIGTLGISIVTLIIDAGFKDRATTLNEMQLYDKYVTELIVLNNRAGPRRLLAQYFANVTVSKRLKKGWIDYYNIVNEEYHKILRQDSMAEIMIIELKMDTLKQSNVYEIKNLQKQRALYKEELEAEIKLVPDNDWQDLKKQITEAENYYRTGSPQGKEEALKIYHRISEGLSEYQKYKLSESMIKMLKQADEAYEKNHIEDAIEKYFIIFRNL